MDYIIRLIERLMCVFGLHDWRADIRSVFENARFCPTCKACGTLDPHTGKVQITRRGR